MNFQWFVPFAILVAVAVTGVLAPLAPQAVTGGPIDTGDTAWMLTASGLVLLMTPGLSFFYGGMVRAKNVISTMLQSFIAMGVVSLLWVVVGFSLAFGDDIGGVVGNPATFFLFRGVGAATHPDLAPTVPLMLFAIFQMKFAIITPALVTGSFAERARFTGYLVFLALFSVLVYAPIAHWAWHPEGFLHKMGVLDFAGGTVVHVVAGVAALVGALVFGQRRDHGVQHRPANVPYVVLGTGMLWFGWFGFNAGSAGAANEVAVNAFLTTNTASAAAMLAWVFLDGMVGRKPTALGASVAAVVGLVAITPAAGFVSVGDSIAIGVIAAVASNIAVYWKSRTDLDDTLDVFPCHGIGGMVGVVLTAVFASKAINPAGADGLAHGGGTTLLASHLIGLGIVVAYAGTASWLLFKVIGLVVPLRVTRDQELEGLDLSQHGESIVPGAFAEEAE